MTKSKTIAAGLAGLLIVSALAGCTTTSTGSSAGSTDTAFGRAAAQTTVAAVPAGHRPTLVANPDKKPAKLAIIAIQNNPFFDQVKQGYTAVEPLIKAQGGTADWINAGNQVTDDAVGNALNAAVVQGYNGVAVLMPDNGICSYVASAVKQKVSIAAYNGDATCAQGSGALFFHGQDLSAAGVEAGKQMCKATAGRASASNPGKVGIETESFTFQALEERRKGFISALASTCPWVTPVNDGIQYQGSSEQAASATRNFMTSTKNLVGVYVTGGNPDAAAVAVGQAGEAAKVSVIGFDLTKENAAQIKAGNMYAVITQDPYGQAYDTLVMLYNSAVAGQVPSAYFVPTVAAVVTKTNVDQAAASQ